MLACTIKKIFILFLVTILIFLEGCASSKPERNAASSIDQAYIGVTSSQGEFDIASSYQNTSQTSKGVLIGGITGGIIGGVTNGIGAVGGVVTGAILGGALGAYIDAHTTLIDKLKNRGVKVIVLGDQVLIVANSNWVFHEYTSNIRACATSTLDLIAQLIGNYINMSVKIAAYTSDTGNKLIDCALSQQQAEKVARYLWKRGVNTRLIYAVGMGGTNLVTRNSAGWDSDNYRIEITFEKLPGCC